MHYRSIALATWLCAAPAAAQVSTDDHALDQLAPAPGTQAKAREAKPSHAVRHVRPAPPAHRLTGPAMPAAPPANPVILPPPFVMPAHAPAAPPPVSVRPDAGGTATPIPGGMRITFGAGSSDLNPTTFAALQAIGAQAAANPATIVSVTGWAPGPADDPSTARRLSLDRALAARAVLIKAGMLSDRIRAVAKGTNEIAAGPADRVDVTK